MEDENSRDAISPASSVSVIEVDVELVDSNLGARPKRNMGFPNTKALVKQVQIENDDNLVSIQKTTEEEKAKEKARAKAIKQELYLAKKKQREEEENQRRKERALKSMKYLLDMSKSYSTFFKNKLEDAGKKKGKNTKRNRKVESPRNKLKTNKPINEDVETKTQDISTIQHIKYFDGGTLKPYQQEGVTWMKVLYENALNGILADEMGLGKTVQVIAFISHLYEHVSNGPFLIVAPLSTLGNWESEFKRFAPKIPIIVFHGSQIERPQIAKKNFKKYQLGEKMVLPVVLLSYQTPLIEGFFLKKFCWEYIIVDEGHRLKNHESKLSKELRTLKCNNRLLLTGTPMQNNITELWSLLNFLMPFIFSDMKSFTELIMIEDVTNVEQLLKEEEHTNLISTIHRILEPFMLRRLKKDVLIDLVPKKELLVYCPLTKLQKELYSYILEKNLAKLTGQEEEEAATDEPLPKRRRIKPQRLLDELLDPDVSISEPVATSFEAYKRIIKMQNPMMMFKKTVDHPFLIQIPLDPNSEVKQMLINEDIVTVSGKMMVLDAMLAKFKELGHKVLIFSTLVMMLDLIEEYMVLRDYKFCRLDGSNNLKTRTESIAEFNTNPDVLAFLISTRAGGLGLNLTGADTVIFFDRDWNPQVDIQAQDRCHRIGQTKPVVVYTLVSKNTIDDNIIICGNLKRRLEKIVIQDGKFKNLKTQEKSQAETELAQLKAILNSDNSSEEIHSNGFIFSDEELQKLLDRSDLYAQMNTVPTKV